MTRTRGSEETEALLAYGSKINATALDTSQDTLHLRTIARKEWQADQRLYKVLAGAGLLGLKAEGLWEPTVPGLERSLMRDATRLINKG